MVLSIFLSAHKNNGVREDFQDVNTRGIIIIIADDLVLKV